MNKICTTIEQSKKLIELGIDINTADMDYVPYVNDITEYDCIVNIWNNEHEEDWIPCWSLAALLGVASTYFSRLEITLRADKKYNVFAAKVDFVFRSFDDYPDGFDNLVDACYKMIIKLHEKNLL